MPNPMLKPTLPKVARSLIAASLFAVTAVAHAQGGPPPSSVQVASATLRPIAPSISVTGVVQSRGGADLAAPLSGRLLWVAEPGQRVRQGEVIARFDVAELRLLRQEQAARVNRGTVAVRAAQREVERMQAAGNAVAKIQVAQSEDARDLAGGDLAVARATLAQTDERIAKAVLRASGDGVVSERLKRAGEETNRGDLIVRLASPQNLELRLFLPLKYLSAMSVGSSVQVQVASKLWPAPVRAIVPVGDARTQSFDAFVDVGQLGVPVTAGDTLKVDIPLAAQRNALVVPRDAVVIRAEGAYVFRLKSGDKGALSAERVPVRIGIASGADLAVEGALAPDDRVVVRGAETLKDGAAVKIVDLSVAAASRKAQS